MNNNKHLFVFEFTPSDIDGRLFNIPLYQRLYAWEEDQIKQLMDDLYYSFEKNKDYYIGNIILSKNDGIYDIIDGQQRLTTLWLIGFVLKNKGNDWENFLLANGDLRLNFIAREEDQKFLETLLKKDKSVERIDSILAGMTAEEINGQMVNAIKLIRRFIIEDVDKNHRENFSAYIYNHTKSVGVVLPQGTDLNKYFEVMNNRGVQLEKHEILKASLLEKLEDKGDTYAAVWDACSQMDQYIEKGLGLKKEVLSFFEDNNDEEKIIKKIQSKSSDGKTMTIKGIIEDDDIGGKSTESGSEEKESKVSSIVSFPKFLLHVYKLFINDTSDGKASLKDKDLLETIKTGVMDKDEAKSFLNNLLKYRILFDQYIVKRTQTDNGSKREIRVFGKSEKDGTEEYRRKRDFKKAAVIQAMLNVSTSAEYWLTPTLKYLGKKPDLKENDFTEWLEKLDNRFAQERLESPPKMKEAANEVIEDPDNLKVNFTNLLNIKKDILNQGTNTPKYWFHKLDYCLWKKWTEGDGNEEIKKWKDKIENFQFRQNRSVEHIHPQNPADGIKEWDEKPLNSFGNLALISPSSNSSYSNNKFEEKKEQFKYRTKRWGIESLKMVDIYKNEQWTETESEEHQQDMIKFLNDYHHKTGF